MSRSRQAKRRHQLNRQASEAALRRVQSARLDPQPGEVVVFTYAWDFALCDCPPDGKSSSQPVNVVAIAGKQCRAGVVARHHCGTSWSIPEHRRVDRAHGAGGPGV